MSRPLRRRFARNGIALAIGAPLTAILFVFVSFSPGTTLAVRAFMIIFMWLFLSLGASTAIGLPAVVRNISDSRSGEPTSDVSSPALKGLRPGDAKALAAMVATLARHDVFSPQVPDPLLLHSGVADYGDVSLGAIFAALSELHYYHPAIPDDAFTVNLAFVPSHGKQGITALAEQIADIDRLTMGALDLGDEAICWSADLTSTDVELTLSVAGKRQIFRWRAAAKYLSTVPHVALAQAYASLDTGYRLATFWTDEGVWLMRLSCGAVDALNSGPDLGGFGAPHFAWLDGERPVAAGAP